MTRPTYTYQLRKVRKHPFIMIEDLDKGRSVTNAIHEIVLDIARKENLNPVEHTIIYMDSMKVWDGYVFSTKQFFTLNEAHWLKAAIKFLNG